VGVDEPEVVADQNSPPMTRDVLAPLDIQAIPDAAECLVKPPPEIKTEDIVRLPNSGQFTGFRVNEFLHSEKLYRDGGWEKGRSGCGEGEFVDHGWKAANDRYVLRLGSVDFSEVGTSKFQIGKIPEVDFMLGISGLPTAFRESGPIVRMTLIDTTVMASVFEFEGELSRTNGWKMSTFGRGESFLYLLPETPVEGNPELGHEWGTRFTAHRSHSYALEIQILEPSMGDQVGEIVLRGGGWK